MRWLFAAVMAVHGVIHLMGFAKAFGFGEFPQLTQPISRPLGLAWLAAAILVLATGALLLAAPRVWWMAGFAAVALSQAVIISSWSDAKYGTAVNVLLLAGAVYGCAAHGPWSFESEYRREVRARLAHPATPPILTEADLAPLPEPVRTYLRRTGSVGLPRVRHFRAVWRGRIRSDPAGPWMGFTAEQHNFPGEPARFFIMDATRSGLPVDVFHAFRDGEAAMRVRLLSLVPLMNAGGPDATRAETVTLINDLCLLAPAALVDAGIRWEPIDARSTRAFYTAGTHTVSAVLVFDEAGDLVDFVSDDRLAASPDGTTFTRRRWSTPVGDYRVFGRRRGVTRGEGRWHTPDGGFVYIELELLDLDVNGGGPE